VPGPQRKRERGPPVAMHFYRSRAYRRHCCGTSLVCVGPCFDTPAADNGTRGMMLSAEHPCRSRAHALDIDDLPICPANSRRTRTRWAGVLSRYSPARHPTTTGPARTRTLVHLGDRSPLLRRDPRRRGGVRRAGRRTVRHRQFGSKGRRSRMD